MIPHCNRRHRTPFNTHPWRRPRLPRECEILTEGPLGLDIECEGWRRAEAAFSQLLQNRRRHVYE